MARVERYTAGRCHRYLSWDMLFPQGLHGAHRTLVPRSPPSYPQNAACLRLGRYPEDAQRATSQSTYAQGGPIMQNEVSWLLICFPDLHQFTFSSQVIYMKIRQPPLTSDEAPGLWDDTGRCSLTSQTLGRLICQPKQGLAL